MTAQEQNQIRELAKKMDNLPDKILERLDDRYLKKDDAPKQFFTRMEGKAISILLSVCIALLTLWNLITQR